MIPLLLVVCFSFALASLPDPKVKYVTPGGIEISVEDVPGLKLKHLSYNIDKKVKFGNFHQAADGTWYHRKDDVGYKNDMVFYTIVGELNGKPVSKDGVVYPESALEAILPPQRLRRAGTTVMRDDFSGGIDRNLWNYEVSMYGGYNWEIQVYTNDELNCFTRDGNLYLKPTLTSDKYGEDYLHTGTMDVEREWGECTNSDRYGCVREGVNGILPPVMSCKLKSKKTIAFGKACARARVPKGDWIWPAIWMLPQDSKYGGWPQSGEIDLMESRGNTVARAEDGNDHGVNEIGSTLHWGPDTDNNKYYLTHGERDDNSYSSSFHDYCVDWTQDHIIITVDDHEVLREDIGAGGFWQRGGFSGDNLWASGTKAAPFDQPFYFIMNVAIGGTNGFFPDGWTYNSKKPWENTSEHEPEEFWAARNDWLPSWKGDDVAMKVDWVELIQY